MAIQVNQDLLVDLKKYGAGDARKCYQCGNCSAVCNLADEQHTFPREQMRMVQLGMESRLTTSLEPWLCYYCGQCSTHCPRGAEPGETMMSIRRWLISRYDVTGLSRLFYESWQAQVFAIVLVALLTGVGFTAWGFTHGDIGTFDGPNAFLNSAAVHMFDWSMAAVLTLFLSMNAFRMWWLTTGSKQDLKIPLASYLSKLPLLPLHFFTQRRYARCDRPQAWLVHLMLMLSYVTMFVIIMFFLHYVQDGPAINWQVHVFGYLASIGLMSAVIYSLHSRMKKAEPNTKHSHDSDWTFLIMLFLVTSTGILLHILHRAGLDVAANVTYVVHMMLVVPMLTLEVPFGKWSHLAYRPLAAYFAEVRRDALARRAQTDEQVAGQGGAQPGAAAG
jgi:ferredoxin